MAFGEGGKFAAERGNSVWLEERIGKEGHPDWRVHLGLLSIVQKAVGDGLPENFNEASGIALSRAASECALN